MAIIDGGVIVPMVWLPNFIFTVFLLLVYDGILGEAIAGLAGGNYLNFLVPVVILKGFAVATALAAAMLAWSTRVARRATSPS